MPRAMRAPRAASLRIFSMMASSFMSHDGGVKYESRGQLFAKDLTHRCKVPSGFSAQIEIRKRPAHQLESMRRHVARAVTSDAGQRGHGIGGSWHLQESFHPAHHRRWRQHLVDRTVEQFACAQARETPQASVDQISFY